MRQRLIPAAAYRRVPWNNGGGVTADIDVVAGAEGMLWRLSVAQIERDGPFSDFTGYDRTIVPIAGGGFRLERPGAASIVLGRRCVPLCFDGGAAMRCELVEGPARALNAMSRQATHTHELAIHTATPRLDVMPHADVRYVMALHAAAVVHLAGEPTSIPLAAGDTLRIDGPGNVTVTSADALGIVAVTGISLRGGS